MLPKIMNVAVPSPQHSPMLGQWPLSQIVWSLCSDTMLRTSRYASPVGSLTRSHLGFGTRTLGAELLDAGGVADMLFVNAWKDKGRKGLFNAPRHPNPWLTIVHPRHTATQTSGACGWDERTGWPGSRRVASRHLHERQPRGFAWSFGRRGIRRPCPHSNTARGSTPSSPAR